MIISIINVIAMIIVLYLCRIWIISIDNKRMAAEQRYMLLLSQKKSSEVRLGQISENLAPFLKEFKYNPKKCHFLGNPIDYIIFEEDKVIFLEIKSGESRLSDTQKNIRKLIKEGKVEFDQMRIN
jgi:hypothetical protein